MQTHVESVLETVARQLVMPGKGILAADESTPTILKRFQSVGVQSTEESRRTYRDMLFTAPDLGDFISGVILFDETIRQTGLNGSPFVEILKRRHIIPGIKVDKGTKPFAGFLGEQITEGLDGLRERLAEYRNLGAQFTKWRAVIRIGPEIPTPAAIIANAHALARFAALSQEAGLVPIVEPEVLMDGEHSIERHAEVTENVLKTVFHTLTLYRVRLDAMLLKPNMVLPGTLSEKKADPSVVARMTWRCMLHCVPAAVPGIVFLSGGQSETQATELLRELNLFGPAPWQLSFSFGRALQAGALKTWKGDPANVRAAQEALLHRARCNSAARFGQSLETLERSHAVAA